MGGGRWDHFVDSCGESWDLDNQMEGHTVNKSGLILRIGMVCRL